MDQVDICNLALNAIGHTRTISAITENSDEAALCGRVFDACLAEVLESEEWDFATAYARPSPLDETTLDLGEVPEDWAYAYAMPSDAVNNGLRRIYSGTRTPATDQKIPFALYHDLTLNAVVILTDEETPTFVYTRRISNYAIFPASFGRAVARRIAIDAAEGLRKDSALAKEMEAAYERYKGRASAHEKRNVQPAVDAAPSWMRNR